jgi:hypothetical protein
MLRRLLTPVIVLAVIAACSSSPAASSPNDGGGGGGSEPSAAASTGGGGGGGASDACGLITADEVATIMGVASATAEATAGDPSYCNYRSDDAFLVATSFGTQNAELVYGAYEGEEGAAAVSGIGDKAVFSPSLATLFFVKGENIVGITAGDGSMGIGDRQDLAEQLGAIAAGRL